MPALRVQIPQVFDKSTAPMFVLRCGDDVITRCNDAMAQTVRKKPSQVVGKPFVEEFLASASKVQQDAVVHLLKNDASMEEKRLVEVRFAVDGESGQEDREVDLLLSINRLCNPYGETEIMCVGQDVTELQSCRRLEKKKLAMFFLSPS